MRRLTVVVVTVAVVAGNVTAAAGQGPFRPQPAVLITPVPDVVMPTALLANPGNVVNRVLSFDVDGDGRVSADELPERMQHVIARGDQDGDGFVTGAEVRNLSERMPFARTFVSSVQTKPFSLVDVITDLRLPQPKRDRALELVKGYSVPRNVNNPGSLDRAELDARLRELLDGEEFENFQAAAARMNTIQRFTVRGVVAVPAR